MSFPACVVRCLESTDGPLFYVFRGRTGHHVCSPQAWLLSLASTCLPSRHLALQIRPIAVWSGRQCCACVPVCNGPAPVVPPAACLSWASPNSQQHRGRVNHGRSVEARTPCHGVSRRLTVETAGIPTRQNVGRAPPLGYTESAMFLETCVSAPPLPHG